MGSFLSTGFVQGGFLFRSRLREVGAVGKWPARATAKSLAAAGHLSTAGVVSARQGLNRGEPRSGRDNRAATLHSVEPARAPGHEAVIRFGGEAPRGGPILSAAQRP